MHKWNTFSIAPLQDLIPIWNTIFIAIHHDTKVGIRDARECVSFVHVRMYVATQMQCCIGGE